MDGLVPRPSTPTLRPYQHDHVARTHAEIAAGHRRIIQVAPTGSGKTVTGAEIIREYVERGQRVREREVIALSGSTGQSTAPHLHFEIQLNEEAVDPMTMVKQPS